MENRIGPHQAHATSATDISAVVSLPLEKLDMVVLY